MRYEANDNVEGRTPLMLAAFRGDAAAVLNLLESGADVNARDRDGDTALMFAAFRGHASPLRHQAALASCAFGGHAIWWPVQAGSPEEALAQLPYFLAERATATRVDEVDIP